MLHHLELPPWRHYCLEGVSLILFFSIMLRFLKKSLYPGTGNFIAMLTHSPLGLPHTNESLGGRGQEL